MKRKLLITASALFMVNFGGFTALAMAEGPVSADVPFDLSGTGFAGLEAAANGAVLSQVVEVRVDQNGKGYVRFTDNLTGTLPGCTTEPYMNALAFDVNTPGGQGLLAMMITAKSTGQQVVAGGTGACTIYTQVEDLGVGYLI